jgi:hypothetical protein
MNLKYSATKTWKQNWVEFVRDIVDFCAYIGLLPCYYKTPGRSSSEDGYVVSKQLIKFRNNEITFDRLLMDFKYSNSSINSERFPQFNIRVRPFYLGLKILQEIEAIGMNLIERRLFFASIACAKNENINEILSYLKKWVSTNGNELSPKNSNSIISKEGGRVATGMQDFYKKFELVEIVNNGKCLFFKITKKGKDLLKTIPPNSLYYGQIDSDTGLVYSPLVANLLLRFATLSSIGEKRLNKQEIISSFKNISIGTIDDCFNNIADLSPSPINEITKNEIILNEFKNQYHVAPVNDFSDFSEIQFIETGILSIRKTISRNQKINLPETSLLNEIYNASISGEGTRYEVALHKAFDSLPGTAIHLGQNTTGQRLSDIVWQVSIPSESGEKKYIVIIEAKSGNAISAFDERKEIDDISNTILIYKNYVKDVDGIWIMVINSDKIPQTNRHGGARKNSNQVSFDQKLFKIQMGLNQKYGKNVLITAFGVKPFIEYYKYLFADNNNSSELNLSYNINQFFNVGDVFTDYQSSYIRILKDENEIKSYLSYGV